MYSKWKIWDYLKSEVNGIDKTQSLHAFSCFDSLAFKFIKDSIPKNILSEEKFSILMGKEITTSWLDDNFFSLGLFGNQDSFVIFNAEEMSKDVKDKFLTGIEDMILDGRFLILNFAKEDAFFKKIQKIDEFNVVKIQEPAFWEFSNLLDFLCKRMNVLLSYRGKEFILEKVPQNMVSFRSILSQIKINYADRSDIDIEEIRPLVQETKVDNFLYAELFGTKKIKRFYEVLVDNNLTFDEYRGLFFFLQSHLQKVFDSSYLDSKPKHSKYDKQILAQSRIWDSAGLNKSINYFSSLEILAKKKDLTLERLINRDFLRTFS